MCAKICPLLSVDPRAKILSPLITGSNGGESQSSNGSARLNVVVAINEQRLSARLPFVARNHNRMPGVCKFLRLKPHLLEPGGQPIRTGIDVTLVSAVGRNGRKSQEFKEVVQWVHRLLNTKTQAAGRRDRIRVSSFTFWVLVLRLVVCRDGPRAVRSKAEQ